MMALSLEAAGAALRYWTNLMTWWRTDDTRTQSRIYHTQISTHAMHAVESSRLPLAFPTHAALCSGALVAFARTHPFLPFSPSISVALRRTHAGMLEFTRRARTQVLARIYARVVARPRCEQSAQLGGEATRRRRGARGARRRAAVLLVWDSYLQWSFYKACLLSSH